MDFPVYPNMFAWNLDERIDWICAHGLSSQSWDAHRDLQLEQHNHQWAIIYIYIMCRIWCHAHTSEQFVKTCAMAKRGSKLLALALSILVARSFVALVETPQVHLGNRHKPPSRTTRTAVDFAKVAQYLEPFVTVIGITRKDVWQGALDANNNLRLISNQTALVDIKEAQAHAECLAQTLVESASTSEKAATSSCRTSRCHSSPWMAQSFSIWWAMCYRIWPWPASLRFMLNWSGQVSRCHFGHTGMG